jgi:hypothetical protein
MADVLAVPAGQVKRNCRIKVYPDGTVGEILACSLATFVPPGWEAVGTKQHVIGGRSGDAASTERARRRAQQRIRDLVLSNSDLDVFWTLTLAPGGPIGRTDYAAVNHKVQQWLADRVRRRGLRYVAVYEYHDRVESDGHRAIHVHGIANHSALRMVDSGRKYQDKLGHWHHIYNLPDWSLGITTAMYLYGDRYAATAYIAKYVRKSERPVGGRWYLHSHNLREPQYDYFDVDFAALPGHEVYVPAARCTYKYIPLSCLHQLTDGG